MRFSADQLASYLLTQSNLQTVMARGDETEDEIRSWLMAELEPLFAGRSVAAFGFAGFVAAHQML